MKRVRACTICTSPRGILLVRLQDPASERNYLFPPGGKVEEGETFEAAAERETREETGYHVRLTGDGADLSYDFDWDGKTYQCETRFFPAELASHDRDPVMDLIYHRGVLWLPREELDNALSYHEGIRRTVLDLLP